MIEVETPALVLDLDAFEANVETAFGLARAAGVSLRPHGKSHKSPDIARRLIAAGAVGTCVATLAEAEAMVAADVEGVLLTAPVATKGQIARIALMLAEGADLMVVADHPDTVAPLSAAADRAGMRLRVLVECDMGQARTGVLTAEAAVTLAHAIAAAPGLTFAGIHAYWGHLQQVADIAERRARVEAQADVLRGIIADLRAEGLEPAIVTGGGTGTFSIDRDLGIFTELQIGSFIFLDSLYGPLALEADGTNPYRHSLFVRAAVVSANALGNDLPQVIVNAGLKAFATDSGLPRLASGPEGLNPSDTTYRYKGDEHGALMLPPGAPVRLGQILDFVPSHCDPTVNLYPRYHLMRGGEWTGHWPILGRTGAA
ncbi:DSD1 family PLP-dependent enzyme [Oceanicola sp. 22II-s10i]|uniref:DSD1 family PLP-dependent enzyme n=1 Tax=Oceanicola sp. 22II-s10i TaxID=1317116 RepID=UPI000B524B14|nr:DSD1 family PLP-dependent enzyme [Oceanicola sp. 22II-s10i]